MKRTWHSRYSFDTSLIPAGEVRWPRRVRTEREAEAFINAVGYCLLFPIKNLPLPSLYYAVTRRTEACLPQAGTWDREMERIWTWKDQLPAKCRAFYAKYIKGRGTFVSLGMLPHFLALEGGAAAHDYNRFYAAGRISENARAVWRVLADHGPLATLELRHACKMGTAAGNIRFKRAMLELQRLLLVVHFGTEKETAAWPSGRFELTARAFPQQVKVAERITPGTARAAIARKYFEWHPESSPMQLARLFGWPKADALAALPAGPR